MILQEFVLGAETTAYLRECLTNGRTLLQRLAELLPIEGGHITCWLPENTPADARAALYYGGIAPPIGPEHQMQVTESGQRFQLVPDYCKLPAARQVLEFLKRGAASVAIFEDQNAYPTDPFLKSCQEKYFTYASDVFYFWLGSELVAEISEEDMYVDRIEPCVLTTLRSPDTQLRPLAEVSRQVIEELAMNTQFILVDAYDGEGTLVWTRPSEAHED